MKSKLHVKARQSLHGEEQVTRIVETQKQGWVTGIAETLKHGDFEK